MRASILKSSVFFSGLFMAVSFFTYNQSAHAQTVDTRLVNPPKTNTRSISVRVVSANSTRLSHLIYKVGPSASVKCNTSSGYLSPKGIQHIIRYTVPRDGTYTLCVRGRREGAYSSTSYEPVSSASAVTWRVGAVSQPKTSQPSAGVVSSRLTNIPRTNTRTTAIGVLSANSTKLSHFIYKIGPSSTTQCNTAPGYTKPVGIRHIIRYTARANGTYRVCVRARRAGAWTSTSYESYRNATTVTWRVTNMSSGSSSSGSGPTPAQNSDASKSKAQLQSELAYVNRKIATTNKSITDNNNKLRSAKWHQDIAQRDLNSLLSKKRRIETSMRYASGSLLSSYKSQLNNLKYSISRAESNLRSKKLEVSRLNNWIASLNREKAKLDTRKRQLESLIRSAR